MDFERLIEAAMSGYPDDSDPFYRDVGVCPGCGRMLGATGIRNATDSTQHRVLDGDLVFCAECGVESIYHGPDEPMTVATAEDYERAEKDENYSSEIIKAVRDRIQKNVALSSRTLNPLAVYAVVHYCMLDDVEPEDGAISVDGLTGQWWFHAQRINEKSEQIAELLRELPTPFHAGSGGGWSFTKASNDRHGNEWTSRNQDMESLFALGIAAGLAKWLDDRDVWHAMPGGVPYVIVF